MKLLLRRSHRPGLLHKIIYSLDVRAHLSAAERALIAQYGLAGALLYQRMELADPGKGLLGLVFRLGFRTANLSVRVYDLIDGKRIECADIVEMLSMEDQIRKAAHTFSRILAAAAQFDADEIVDL